MIHGEGGTQLGLLLAISLVVALVAMGVWAVGGHGAHHRTHVNPLVGAAATGALLAFLLGTFGGVSSIIAFFITPQIRVWSRLTPFVAFFCLILLAYGLDWMRGYLRARTTRAWGGIALALVAIVGVLDQTSPLNVPPYAANAAAWTTRAAFVARIERTVPRGSMVLQLPLYPFPEGAPTDDHSLPAVLSDNLRWSYGAIKGRPSDWTDEAAALPLGELAPAAAAAGFAGIYVDRDGYPADHGKAVEAGLAHAIGSPVAPIVSTDGRFVFYPLGSLDEHLHRALSTERIRVMATALLTPLSLVYGEGFYPEEQVQMHRSRWATHVARMVVRNPARVVQRARFSAVFSGLPGTRVRVLYQDRTIRTLRLRSRGTPVSVAVTVPPGEGRFVFDAGVAHAAYTVRLMDPTLVNLAFRAVG